MQATAGDALALAAISQCCQEISPDESEESRRKQGPNASSHKPAQEHSCPANLFHDVWPNDQPTDGDPSVTPELPDDNGVSSDSAPLRSACRKTRVLSESRNA